jgi:hypothetical protein
MVSTSATTFSVVGSVIDGQYLVLAFSILVWLHLWILPPAVRTPWFPLGLAQELLLAVAPFTAAVLNRRSPSRKLLVARHSSRRLLVPLLLCAIGVGDLFSNATS